MKDRLDEELVHIRTQELAPYYLALREKGEKVDTDRHLVAYLIGLTDEFSGESPRMMGDMPDIDVDFSERPPVVEYLKEKYGDDKVAYINNYTHLSGISALNDVSRVMEVTIPKNIKDAVNQYKSIKSFIKTKPDVSDEVKEALKVGARLEGNVRHMGVTAAGVVVCKDPITDYVALYKSKDEVATGYDKDDVESVGLLKMDVLRTSNVAAMQRTIELIEERGGTPPEDVWNLPLDDERMIKEFAKGNTDLIFQYAGFALKKVTMDLNPKNVDDIVAANSLVRPGADQMEYIRRKESGKEITYPHPLLKDILSETYGLPIYQEQVMAICRQLAGMSHQDVNRVRKMMGKKTYKDEPELSTLFYMGCKKNGVDEALAKKLWAEIKKHGGYSFNKAHCVAYFVIAWANMYFQVYHPFEWYLANLQIEQSDDKISVIVANASKAGIKISNVDVNKSRAGWTYDGDTLVPGLSNIKGLGIKTANKIVAEAMKSPITGYETEVFRPGLKTEKTTYLFTQENGDKFVVPKNAFEVLSNAGAIPGVEGDRNQTKVASGQAIDVTEGKKIHKWWKVKPLSQKKDGLCFIHGYVKSATKSGTDYKINIQSDIAGVMYGPDQLEPGPYILICDGKWNRVYYAIKEKNWDKHPMTNWREKALLATWGPGIAFCTGSVKVKKKYPTLILAPQPRILWLNEPLERGWYRFNFLKNIKGWHSRLVKKA
jgi:DNA polymerase III alpha subunit